MKLFFDTEFTGLHKDTSLISIGIISEDNKHFYAELNDYDKSQVDEWILKNVIDNLLYNDNTTLFDMDNNKNIIMKDTKANVKKVLLKWLHDNFNDETIEFVSDVSSYDFVLLVDLIAGCSLDLPDNVVPYCYDINQDISKYLNISLMDAFNANREDIVKSKNIELKNINKHNSMFDAKIIMCIYSIINKSR